MLHIVVCFMLGREDWLSQTALFLRSRCEPGLAPGRTRKIYFI